MKKYGLFFICVLCLNMGVFAQSGTIKIKADNQHSVVSYYMSHPLHDFEGNNKKVSALILFNPKSKTINTAAVVLSVSDFSSGNGNRDSHAMETLEALKYPLVSFTSTAIREVGDSLAINGILNFHNVKRAISFKASKKITGNNLNVIGSFSIDMTDYQVKPPSLLGMETRKTIKLVFNINFKLP